MKILFVTYYFEPEPVVGAKRVSYWALNIKQYGAEKVGVISTTENRSGFDSIDEYFHLPNTKGGGLIGDPGNSWSKEIFSLLNSGVVRDYDVVVMSGGPFMQFRCASQFKSQLKCKIILDYRDPFAINPRFNNSWLKVKIKSFYERQFNRAGDQIISVNEYCLGLLMGYNKSSKKFHVIRNGYDEGKIDTVIQPKVLSDADGLNLIYAGSVYEDRNPTELLKAIDEDVTVHHVGRPNSLLVGSRVIQHGMKDYEEMLEYIAGSDLAVIITSGAPFESTTKIYDYIACNVPILIITDGQLQTGSLHEDTKDYPHCYWVKNSESSIREFVQSYRKPEDRTAFNKEQYSRRAGLQQLVELIKEKG